MHALVRCAQIAAAGAFTTGEIRPHVTAALRSTVQRYGLGSLRYDLSKLRVDRLPALRETRGAAGRRDLDLRSQLSFAAVRMIRAALAGLPATP